MNGDPVYAAPARQYRATGRAPDRLLGWIRWSMRLRPNCVWAKINMPYLCRRLGISERTCWRAKSYLMANQEHYGLRWITLRSRGKWCLLVALDERLLFDRLPLLKTTTGEDRRVRDWIRGTDAAAGHPVTDKHYTRGVQYSRTDTYTGPVAVGIQDSIGTMTILGQKRPPQRLEYPPPKPGYFHSLARRLEREHWDNCKVTYLHRSTVGFVRRCLSAGCRPSQIIGHYSEALHAVHMQATDDGLNQGRPCLKYLPPPVYAKAYYSLGFERIDTDIGPVYVRAHSILI